MFELSPKKLNVVIISSKTSPGVNHHHFLSTKLRSTISNALLQVAQPGIGKVGSDAVLSRNLSL